MSKVCITVCFQVFCFSLLRYHYTPLNGLTVVSCNTLSNFCGIVVAGLCR